MSSGSLSLFFLKVQQTEAVFSCTCVIKSELMKKIIIASHPQHCTSMHCRDCKCVRCGITKGILCPATGKRNPPEFSEISRNISTLLNSFAGYWKLDREFTCRNRVTFKGKRARGWSWNIFGSRLLRALTSLTSQGVGRLCTAAVVIFILPDVKAEANSLQPSQSFYFFIFYFTAKHFLKSAENTKGTWTCDVFKDVSSIAWHSG